MSRQADEAANSPGPLSLMSTGDKLGRSVDNNDSCEEYCNGRGFSTAAGESGDGSASTSAGTCGSLVQPEEAVIKSSTLVTTSLPLLRLPLYTVSDDDDDDDYGAGSTAEEQTRRGMLLKISSFIKVISMNLYRLLHQ